MTRRAKCVVCDFGPSDRTHWVCRVHGIAQQRPFHEDEDIEIRPPTRCVLARLEALEARAFERERQKKGANP